MPIETGSFPKINRRAGSDRTEIVFTPREKYVTHIVWERQQTDYNLQESSNSEKRLTAEPARPGEVYAPQIRWRTEKAPVSQKSSVSDVRRELQLISRQNRSTPVHFENSDFVKQALLAGNKSESKHPIAILQRKNLKRISRNYSVLHN